MDTNNNNNWLIQNKKNTLFHLKNAVLLLTAWLLHAVLVVDEVFLVDHRSELLQTDQTSPGLK